GLIHTDQRNEIVAKVPAILSDSVARERGVQARAAMVRTLPTRASRSVLVIRMAASRLQKTASVAVSGNAPRSQNHWYECRSHVTKKTAIVARIIARRSPYRRSLKNAG